MNQGVQLVSALVAMVSSVILAVWVLSNKIATMRSEMVKEIATTRSEIVGEIATLKTDLAVMKKSEEARDEKIKKMWDWWLESLASGWREHMKAQTSDK